MIFYFLFSFFRFGIASSSILGVACAFWAALVTIKAFGLAFISLIDARPSGFASSSHRAGHSAFSALRLTCQNWRFGEMNFEWVNFALESSSVLSEAFSRIFMVSHMVRDVRTGTKISTGNDRWESLPRTGPMYRPVVRKSLKIKNPVLMHSSLSWDLCDWIFWLSRVNVMMISRNLCFWFGQSLI